MSMMPCSNCQTELPEDAQFCFTCGQQVGGDIRCRSCYGANPAGATFCQLCGQPLPQPGESDPLTDLRRDLDESSQKLDLAAEQNRLNARERQLYTEEKRSAKEAQTQQQVDAARLERGAALEIHQIHREAQHRAALDETQRQDEQQRQRETYQTQRDDRQRARQHELKLQQWERKQAELEAEMAYKRELVDKSQELTETQRTFQRQQLEQEHREKLERARRELEGQNDLAQIAQSARIAREQELFGHLQSQQEAERKVAREARNLDRSDDLAHERARAEFESQRDARDLELALEAQQKLVALKQQQKDADARREVDILRGKSEVETAFERARHEMHLEQLGKLNELSPEALIAASPGDQARLLAELRQTEALKGLTEEQILARAAERSPAVAAAIAEKYKSAGSQAAKEEMRDLYERMFTAQSTQSQQHLDSMQRLMETALNAQRDTAVAAAGGRPQPAQAPPATSAAASCRHCGQPLAPQARFCGKCGTSQAQV